jgi:uncharacterized membrane protein YbhN (UPF0104 family)
MQIRFVTFIKSVFSRLIVLLNNVNRRLITFIAIGITIIVLGILVYRQREIIINYQWQFRPIPILLSFVIFSIALFWVAIVWGWIVNNLGMKLRYAKHIRYYIVSNLAKRIPGTIWYVASRFQFYVSDGLDIRITALASGIEMVLIILAGIIVVLVFSAQTLLEHHISPIILFLIFLLGLLIIHPKVIQWFLRRRKIESSVINYKFIIKGIVSYAISWMLGGIVLFEFGNIIYPISIGNITYFIASWALVGIISSILFFSPSNFGITEIGLSLLLSKIVPTSIAVLIAVLSRILMILYEIIWVGFYLWLKPLPKNSLTQKD